MTKAVDLGRKATKQANKTIVYKFSSAEARMLDLNSINQMALKLL